MNRVAGRAWITMLLVLTLLAGFVFFLCEYFASAGQWVVFSGSPHIYSGGNIDCGVVVDRENILLLDMNGDRVYGSDPKLRSATVHWLGDREGNIDAPALPNYAEQIAGFDILNGVYTYGDGSGVVELSVSAAAQMAALDALGNYKGTVAVYNYKTGEIICAVTTPTYDPDHAPDLQLDTSGALEGLYVNRFTQSTYTPGSIFKIVTLAAALETIPDIQSQSFSCTGSYEIGGDKIVCEAAHGTQDLKTAFCNSCNCAFAQISLQLGGETLARYVEQFQITDSVQFDGITTAAGSFEVSDAQVNVAWSAIGQYNDQINPAAFLTYIGAVANEGKGVMPHLVSRITVGGTQTYLAKTTTNDRIMSATTAKTVREFMGFNVSEKYGSWNFPDLNVCAKTGTAEVGGGKRPNAMLAGFVADEAYPLAFVVCVEDAGYGATVCIPIASKVLSVCKNTLAN